MKATLQRTCKATSRTDPKIVHVSACGRHRLIKEGTVVDHADVYRLCMMGYAKPADAECLERLAYEGWGPDVFDDKFAIAAAQLTEWEKGIRAANTSTPEAIPQQVEPEPEPEPEIVADDTGDTDSGQILFDSETPED